MNNKIIIVLTALVPLTASANDFVDYFSGAYIGGGLGATVLTSSQQLVFDPTKVANTSLYNRSQSTNDTYTLGQVYLGYGTLFSSKPIYIAVEAIGEFSKPNYPLTTNNVDAYLKQNNTYGGRAKLGYVRDNQLIYVLAGAEHASIKRNVLFSANGIYNTDTMSLQNIESSNGTTIPQVGAGFTIALNSNWAAQLEYAHNFYDDKNYAINHRFITFNNPKGNYTTELSSDQVTLGVRYKWMTN